MIWKEGVGLLVVLGCYNDKVEGGKGFAGVGVGA